MKEILVAKRNEETPKSYTIQSFEKLFALSYLSKVSILKAADEHFLKKKIAKKKELMEAERKWLGAYFAPFLKEEKIAAVYIKWVSDFLGYGVFTLRPLAKGSYVGEYTGELVRYPLFNYAPNSYCFAYPTSGKLFNRFSINAQESGNELRFINHSDTPNCEAVGVLYEGLIRIVIRTLRQIGKDEQLTYDYGEDYWRKRTKLPN